MISIAILLVGIIGFSLMLLVLVKKNIKKIGQKKYIVYNQVYRKFINFYYNTEIKKELLKQELVSYYSDVIDSKKCHENFKDYELFLEKMLGKIIKEDLVKMTTLENDFNLLNRFYNWLLFLIILIIVTFGLLVLFYKI